MLKVLELFGGIGACSNALKRLDIDFEIADYVEIDKYAVKSYNAIYETNFEPQDITRWDKDIKVDLIMHGSPCQDFSLAGKQAGGDINSGTRSSLMWHTVRIVEKLKPKYVVWENVKNVLSKKHKHNFDAYLEKTKDLGYTNYYQVLNAKDYGIPQNRERVFTISILNSGEFEFPQKQELELKLKDLLENEVDEKYYLSDKGVEYILSPKRGMCTDVNPNVAQTVTSKGMQNWTGSFVSDDIDHIEKSTEIGSSIPVKIHMKNGCILIKNATKKGYDEAQDGDSVNLEQPNSKTRRGRVGHGVAQTLTTSCNQGVVVPPLRIRKLTPKECWRLMGFNDYDFEKVERINSNTQLYKQAGNSIVVDVLVKIFTNLLKEEKEVKQVNKTITYTANEMIDLAKLIKKEPELFEELIKDYPAEHYTTYIYEVS